MIFANRREKNSVPSDEKLSHLFFLPKFDLTGENVDNELFYRPQGLAPPVAIRPLYIKKVEVCDNG